jgi:hypothetical protein
MNSLDRDLARAARKGANDFEILYKSKVNNKISGPDLALKFQYYLAIDPNTIVTGGNTKTNDGETSTGQKVSGNIIEFFGKGLITQEKKEYLPGLSEEMIGVQNIMDTLLDSKGDLNDLSKIGENLINNLGGQLELYFEQQTGLIDRINKQAGLTGKLAKDFREELTNANPRLLQLGIGFDDLAASVKTAFEASGRFNLLNQQTLEKAGEIALAYVGDLNDLVRMYSEFEKVGLGASDAQEKIAKAGKEALGLGLRSQTVTTELNRNIGKLNEYGFKNGIDGLSTMVRKATEFRMSMDSVFTIADKVLNPDGAIELAANLQVLGGAIGDFNDPLKLMYMATNNVEGLQDALIGAASSLTTYNSEQGRFEITGVNLRRAKEMAAQLGISYQELAKGAVAAAERTSASADLMARGLNLDKKQEEFITNLAQMKGGKMVIEIGSSESLKKYFDGQSTVKLEELTQEQVNELMKYQNELKEMTSEQVVKQQASDIENMKRDVNYIAALLRIQAGRISSAVMMETLAATTGKSMKDLETSFAEWSKNQTGGIKELKDRFLVEVTKQIGTAKDFIDNKNKTNNQNQTNNQTKEDKKNQTVESKPKVENLFLNFDDRSKDKVPDSNNSDINKQNTTPVNKTDDKNKTVFTEPKNVNNSLPNNFLSDFEKTYGSINKDNQKSFTFDINRDKPLDVKIAEESITKLVKKDVKPLLNEPKNVSTNSQNNFLSGFEKTYGSINKGNEQSVVKVNPQNIETQKNIDLQKAISEQNQKSSLVNNNEQKTNTEENKSVSTVVHKHIVEMNVSSTGPIVDVLARAMLKDPTIVSQFIGRDVREFV